MDGEAIEPTFRAFISYSRQDYRYAHWLHRALESYIVPRHLVGVTGSLGPVPKSLSPIFRDRTDLNAGGVLSDRISEALSQSACLVVLCSPSAGASSWVNKEVEAFIKLGKSDRIFPVVVAGAGDGSMLTQDCFPPALRDMHLLAADLRDLKRNGRLIGDGRQTGRLKLISGLLGVGLDVLTRRETQRQRGVLALLSLTSMAFLGLAAAAMFFGNLALNKEKETRQVLNRFFVTNGWIALGKSQNYLAARYALVGDNVAPENEDDYRALLGAAFFDHAQVIKPITVDAPIMAAALSNDGQQLLVATGAAAFLYSGVTGELIRQISIPEYQAWNFELRNVKFNAPSTEIVIDYLQYNRREEPARSRMVNGPEPYKMVRVTLDTTGDKLIDRRSSNWLTAPLAPLDQSQVYSAYRPLLTQAERIAERAHLKSPNIADGVRSTDGRRFLEAHPEGTVEVRAVSDGRVIATLRGHDQAITHFAFSHDGTRVITSSHDSTARIWSALTGQEIATLRVPSGSVSFAAFSLDGRRAVTFGTDRTVRVWDTKHVTQGWKSLRRDACGILLMPDGRRFRSSEIASDPLLQRSWNNPDQDVCADSTAPAASMPLQPFFSTLSQLLPPTKSPEENTR